MRKEYLEALDNIKSLLKDDWVDSYWKTYYEVIKQALIKAQEDEEENKRLWNDITTVSKQYTDLMLTYQEQKKVLEIIKKKHISVWRFRNIVFGYEQKQNGNNVNDTYEYYTHHFGYYHEGFEFKLLTEEEFELFKRYFK